MAFTGNITCNSFKTGLMNGSFDFSTDTFYIALYTNAATLDYSTTEYTSTGEVVASGYSASPLTVTVTPTTGSTGTVAYISFSNVSWTAAFTARGALIYKPGADGAICVLDFGSDKTSTTTFTVQFPAATNTSAIIRIA
jgi:hypothetical protein